MLVYSPRRHAKDALIKGLIDSNYSECLGTKKSTTCAYGTLISWNISLHNITVLSTNKE